MPWCSPFLPPMHNAHFTYIFLVINKGLYIAPKKQEILCSLGLYIARNMYMGTHKLKGTHPQQQSPMQLPIMQQTTMSVHVYGCYNNDAIKCRILGVCACASPLTRTR